MRSVGLNWLLALGLAIASSSSAQLLLKPIKPEELRSNAVIVTQSNGNWAQHLGVTDRLLSNAWALAPAYQPTQRLRAVVEDDTIAWALADAAFVRRVTPAALTAFADSPSKREFLCWLLQNRAALEDFVETVREQDDVPEVLRIWSSLWSGDVKGREKYYRLALACALVFDRPIEWVAGIGYGKVQPSERYNFYRNAAEISGLVVPVTELAPFELVWVVDAPVPDSELDWARRNVRYARAQWGEAYSAVAYRMDRAMAGADPYKSYTLAEIRAKGGICGDQAHYAAISAKASGIPAMAITGSGQRGGHAWFGFKASPQQWNLRAGRYEGDRYITGFCTDPQTGQQIKDHQLLLLADAQRRQPEWRIGSRLVWLADWLAAANNDKLPADALALAVTLSNRHLPAWTALFAQLCRDSKLPRPKWEGQLAAYRAAFRPYPDTLALADTWEAGFIKQSGTPKDVDDLLRQQQRRIKASGNDRSDLLLDSVAKRIAACEERNDLDGAIRIYKQTLRDEARDLQVFRALAQRFFSFGERHSRLHETVRTIYSEFRRLPVPDADPFARRAYAGIEEEVAAYLERDGQKNQAKVLRQQATARFKATAAGW